MASARTPTMATIDRFAVTPPERGRNGISSDQNVVFIPSESFPSAIVATSALRHTECAEFEA
jgi:hypothetical protein